ncbi:ribosome biogenesis GTP-binding protein YihA/YsxC [Alphaproteobacteria bacterium]|nr:ribosome biogenesis GTP-binding protein YihA/YsxC [Alphaproteobacteria bacterium]
MSLVSNYFKKQTTFLLSATQPRQYPNVSFPEIAFIGRSNVGKSSLINAIFMKNLAYISNTPGKTRQINFFNHGDSMMVVDLPGYGFAKISQKEAFQISDLVSQYLTSRENLKKIFVLIDNSLGPKKIDIEMIDSMREIKEKVIICYTKSDKKIKEKSPFIDELNHKFENFVVSSKTKDNVFEIQKKVFEFL